MNKEKLKERKINQKFYFKPHTSQNKGITLVALIITIIVLLILAVVAIKALQGDGIIRHAKNSQTNYNNAQDKEQIKLALDEWLILSNTNTSKTFLGFMKEKFGANNVITTGENEVKITLSNGKKYEAKTNGIVAESIPVGSYVQYNVEYKDMYTGTTYNANNGWRYLGIDDNGNKLIVSTGIPAILNYTYNPDTKPDWWATDADVKADSGIYNTSDGWDFDNNGKPQNYATYGLRHKFKSIPFSYATPQAGNSVSTANTGIFKQVGSIVSGNLPTTAFEATEVDVIDVHNLTLAELNRATNKVRNEATRTDTSTDDGFKDLIGKARGLFELQLLGESSYGNYTYCLATPDNRSGAPAVYIVAKTTDKVMSVTSDDHGVRPVVVLPSNVNLTIVNN